MTSRRALLGVLLFALACREAPREVPAVRLLDLAPGAEVRWPRQRTRRLPEAIDGPRTFRALRLGRVGRVAMFPAAREGDSRLSLLAPTPTRYDFVLTPPAGAVLELSLGYVPPAGAGGSKVGFSVFLTTADGGGQVMLDLELETRPDGDWVDRRLDLADWAGREVSLTLQTRGDDTEAPVWAAWGAPEIVSPPHPERGPDVILISLDTLRADRLGSYGYERPTSPNLDRLAARSVRFATAVSQAPWTRPSHQSMFSGFYPSSRDRPERPVLAEALRARGFRTEALTGGGQMDFRLGFADGFDGYRVFDWIRDLDELERCLEASAGRRRFLFLHTYEIHDPYTHTELVTGEIPEGVEPRWDKKLNALLRDELTDERKRLASELYDGGIAFADRRLGELFERFEARGVFERSIVVVTSDHGEQFWEHGSWRHGMNLFDHQLLVPLIVHLPPGVQDELGGGRRLTGRVIEQQVRLVDLHPTLLDLLGVPLEHRVDGRSLVPLLEGGELPEVDAFAESLNVKFRDAKALRSKNYKYVFSYPKAPGVERGIEQQRELYDLTRDPGEQHDLAADRPDAVAELDARLQTLLELLADPSELELDPDLEGLDPDLRERLEALGYLGD